MSRSASTAIENNFVNGWVTEATGLNFPENAVTDSDNYMFISRGVVKRRLGIDAEEDVNYVDIVLTDNTLFTEYLWESVAGDGRRTFYVQQVGGSLRFYQVSSTNALSQNYLTLIDLSPYAKVGLTIFQSKPFQYTSGFGRLFVAHPNMDPLVLTYDPDTNTISVAQITIETRDTKGAPGGPVGRLSSLTSEHNYNLLNQGWDTGKMNRMFGFSGVFPSDYDVWWLYKTPDALGTEVFLTDVAYAAGILTQVDRGNSPAPKGSFTLNEFYQDRSAVSSVPGLPVISAGVNRPSSITFFAGRVFYAGVSSQDYNSKVYFSQILEDVNQAGRCYQQNDPTTQYSPDLLPTDGGVIAIPEVGTVLKLWTVEGSLLVFCSNGIWQITGSQGIGFAANDYTVRKLSSQEILSGLSFVNVLGNPVWWSSDGIYTITTDSVGSLSVKSLSEKKIKTYYQDLPVACKTYAKGAFNLKTKIIQWVYREEEASSIILNQTYTKILNYDVTTEAFFKYTIDHDVADIKGISALQGVGGKSEDENVVDLLGVTVATLLGAPVQVEVAKSAPVSSMFKYVFLKGDPKISIGFAEERNKNWLDWDTLSVPDLDAKAFFTTGYRIRGEAQRKFQPNYLVVYAETDEPCSFKVQSRFEYAITGNTGEWSSKQTVLMYGNQYSTQSRRLKLRGHGKVCQYLIESVPGYASNVIGWSAWDTTNGGL